MITDRKLFADTHSFFSGVEEALKAGLKAVQLREKDLATRDLLEMAYRMRDLTMRYNAKLFINDRADIAMCVNADGVHLGQSSMPVYAVRNVVGENLMIGVSAHNLEEAETAEREKADFITFGPVYRTPSKLIYGEPVGLEELKRVATKINIPVFGLGGVKLHNVKDVIETGACGVSLISGILGESDIKGTTGEYLKLLGEKA